MAKRKSSQQRLIVSAVVLIVLAGVLIVVLDWREAWRLIGKAQWQLVLPAFLFTAASYLCLSYGLASVYWIFGIRMSQKDLLEIGFVSIVLNHLITVAGLAGLSLRIMLMKRRGLPTEDILAPSLFHSYFNNLALLSLLPIGLLHILVNYPLSQQGSWGIGVAAGVLFMVLFFATFLVFIRSARALLLREIRRLWRRVTRHDIESSLRDFDIAMARGVAVIRHRPLLLGIPLGLIAGDWFSSIVALWFCFHALGSPIGIGVLLTGFGIGVTLGLLSLVPGGLGVQEGSMAAIYALLGVPLEQAILAAILFRVVYYFVPFLLSLSFYRRLLRGAESEPQG